MDDSDDGGVALEASVIGLGLVLRSLAPALEHVTLQQYRVLVLVVTRGRQRSGDLAAELGLLPSGVTRIVDRLVRDGLVERTASDRSGREVLVRGTDRAVALVHEVLDARRVAIGDLLQRMTGPERDAVMAAARAIVRTAGDEDLSDARSLLPRDERHGRPV
ncbi:MarR family transcriptional regulator [Curtobacterium citreum]|uniref:MarR family transcriptional regulator n=1 Tax=Curtobacterium citreum TaxID=2036 RepID=UPI00254FBE3C|nr:MarR family transcriptional regulator [Curtobacterium citreum]MDK8172058.1 MarR family transcriptional regulator [Curtobacterium citreum]